jgi:hypothetical protein
MLRAVGARRIARATRNAHLWLPGYLADRWHRRSEGPPRTVRVTIADHFEPLWQKPALEVARARVAEWRKRWPEIAARHRDSAGRPPQYGFFYPAEEYRPELLEPLAEMTRMGLGDVEVHLHHDADTSQGFADKVARFTEALHSRHGLLRKHGGKRAFGFIHGNWALDNGRPDGRWCGVNDEIRVLQDLGCYADFTMPAAPDPSQGGLVNAIYRVTDDPQRPRSYESGVPVKVGTPAVGDLTLIPGPLGVFWKSNGRLKPRLDTGELAAYAPSSPARARLWLTVAPRIGDHAFVKLFSHGAPERNAGPLLGGGLDRLFEDLEQACAGAGATLHYVTAWEMWRAVEALREGREP